jgi:3-hydroxybutyryl-CoA dehydrogenase
VSVRIDQVSVIGSGVMGSGIGQSLATAGYRTRVYDRDPAQLERAALFVRTGRYGLDRGVERGKLTREDADAALARLEFCSELDAAVTTADLVIEAVPESLAVKIPLLRRLDELTPVNAILASNSSGLSVTAMSSATDRPERVLTWHWASPPVVQPFAEIVRTERTDPAVVAAVVEVATRCGKNPVVVTENERKWGYAANRIYVAMVAEAEKVVADGVATREQVDQLMCDAYSWPVGPFAMLRGANEGWGEGWSGTSGKALT